MFYFKRRRYQVIGNVPIETVPDDMNNASIFFGINRPWTNPDSSLLAAMEKDVICGEYSGTDDRVREICYYANRHGRCNYQLSEEENERVFAEEETRITESIEHSLSNGGTMLSLQFGKRTIGIVTVNDNRIDNLYVEGCFQKNGFGTQLLQYAISFVGKGAYIVVPKTNKILTHICESLESLKNTENLDEVIRFIF